MPEASEKTIHIMKTSLLFRLVALCMLVEIACADEQRTNILFILTDNQAASLMGAYGNPDIRTPHIDQLAREGMKFTRAYAVNGMCSPTRATLMTGLMPSQHGIHSWLNDELLNQWPENWSAVAEYRTLPLTLKNRGYRTAMIGKWHLGQPWKASIGYQYWVTFPYGHTIDFWDNTIIDNDKTYEVNDRHIVDYFTDKAVEYLQDYSGEEPFYLQLNYDGPYTNPPTNYGPARNRFYRTTWAGNSSLFHERPITKTWWSSCLTETPVRFFGANCVKDWPCTMIRQPWPMSLPRIPWWMTA